LLVAYIVVLVIQGHTNIKFTGHSVSGMASVHWVFFTPYVILTPSTSALFHILFSQLFVDDKQFCLHGLVFWSRQAGQRLVRVFCCVCT